MVYTVNMLLILNSWVATMVNVMDSCENSKKDNENRYISSYVCRLLTFQKEEKKQCFSSLQCHSFGVVEYFDLRVYDHNWLYIYNWVASYCTAPAPIQLLSVV